MSANNKDKDFAPINVEMSDRIPLATNRQHTNKSETSQSSGSTVFANVVAIGALGLAGYLFYIQQQTSFLLENSSERIQILENRLSTTGEEIGNSTVELQVRVGELTEKTETLWEQMDKLWASAWRRNQQEIQAATSSIKNLQRETNKLIADLKTEVTDNDSSLNKLQTRIEGASAKLNSQANDILSVTVMQEEIQQAETTRNQSLRQMAEKLILLEKRNTSLLQEIQKLEKKVDELAKKTV